jgi:hypothetical protein
MSTRSHVPYRAPSRLTEPVPRHYYAGGSGGWFVVHCANLRAARRFATAEFGRGNTQLVRPAMIRDVADYCAQKNLQWPELPFEQEP